MLVGVFRIFRAFEGFEGSLLGSRGLGLKSRLGGVRGLFRITLL